MEFNEYQKLARKTAIYAGAGKNFVYPALGLCGESGEVAEKIKKIVLSQPAFAGHKFLAHHGVSSSWSAKRSKAQHHKRKNNLVNPVF